MDDLEAAISKAKLAVSITLIDHPDQAILVQNPGNRLLNRYNQIENMDDLEAAISNTELAVFIIPLDHPDQAMLLQNLAHELSNRYSRT